MYTHNYKLCFFVDIISNSTAPPWPCTSTSVVQYTLDMCSSFSVITLHHSCLSFCTACLTRDNHLVRSVSHLQPGGRLAGVASHDTVNHSVTSVAPSGVHTQSVESYWNRVKHNFKKLSQRDASFIIIISLQERASCFDPFLVTSISYFSTSLENFISKAFSHDIYLWTPLYLMIQKR